MAFQTLILAGTIAIAAVSDVPKAGPVLRDFSNDPVRLVICNFGDADFAHTQLNQINWAGYAERQVTVAEFSEARAATHVSTAFGPMSQVMSLNLTGRKREAREQGCNLETNEIILFGKSGQVVARWNDFLGNDDLFQLLDSEKFTSPSSGIAN